MSAFAEHWPETPQPVPGGALFGTRAVATTLRMLGIPFAALNPGASFGGYKQSGIGREESFDELLSYTQLRNVYIAL